MSKLLDIKSIIYHSELQNNLPDNSVKLLAVTKNQPAEKIIPLLDEGQRLFGENRVQEASVKWPALKKNYSHLELHLIGHLQTNKVSEAVALFDVIQTLDSLKLARKLWAEEQRQRKHLVYCIEINIGGEVQKSGISVAELPNFIDYIRNNYSLKIEGLMCIPPKDKNPSPYFQQMRTLSEAYSLPIISMGMSEDYQLAIKCGSTMVRIGRALFE